MRCNCTVCTKVGLLMGMAKPEGFRVLAGERDLSSYEWGAKTAKRYFCKRCGVSCFSRGYLEQLGGEYVCVSFRRPRRHRPERSEDGVLGRPARQLAGRLARHAVADPRLRVRPTATPSRRRCAPRGTASESRLDDPEFDGSKHGHGAVGHAHFAEDARYLVFHSSLGGSQSGGDLLVGHASGD